MLQKFMHYLYQKEVIIDRASTIPDPSKVLCQVVYIHANKHVLHGTPESFTVDAAKLRPVARLGGNDFVELGDFYDIDRPRVDDDLIARMAAGCI
eukprot:g45965.t1